MYMKDVDLGALLPIFLFFALFAGIVIIYREEIAKIEFIAKLQTTPVPPTDVRRSDSPGRPDVPDGSGIPNTSSGSGDVVTANSFEPLIFRGQTVSFGNGYVVDSSFRAISSTESVSRSGSLHTVAPEVAEYYARAFVEEASGLYEASPHVGSVAFLDRASSVKERDPNREYFVLIAEHNLEQPVTITGWKVFDREGKVSYTFPQGVKVLGSNEVITPISVHSGDTIIVSSGRSPVGFSFQVNKCSGYRSQFKSFVPTIKTSCSDPIQDFLAYGEVSFSDDACYQTVSSMRPCIGVTHIPRGVTPECTRFLEHVMTEKGCVAQHQNDNDFFVGEWRLFLKSERELWKNRDNVLYLLDENDLLVATLVYR